MFFRTKSNINTDKKKELTIPLFSKRHIFYDTIFISPENTNYAIEFFAVPLGQISEQELVTKSIELTNMTISKTIPIPQQFDLYGISYDIPMATDTDRRILSLQNFQLHINSYYNFITTPLSNIPTNNCKDFCQNIQFVPMDNYITNYFPMAAFDHNNRPHFFRMKSGINFFFVQMKTDSNMQKLSTKQPLIISLHGILHLELR